MIYIKKFIDKISYMESRNSKDLVMPMVEAKGLRDELAKLLAELHFTEKEDPVIQVEIKGGSFK